MSPRLYGLGQRHVAAQQMRILSAARALLMSSSNDLPCAREVEAHPIGYQS
jgi:hypothetical protein